MLVEFQTTDGHTVWINAIHVRSVARRTGMLGGDKGTEIALSGLAVYGSVVRVHESVGAVAARISHALQRINLAGVLDDEFNPPQTSNTTAAHSPSHTPPTNP